MCSRLTGRRIDSRQRQEARGRPAGALREQFGVASDCRRRRRKGAEDRDGNTRPAARRVDRKVGRRAQPLDARAVLAPLGEPLLPGLGLLTPRRRVRRRAGAPRLVRVDPRLGTPPATSEGNVSSRLPRSPLGSIAMTGTPSMAASSMSDRHRPGLAAAGHADAHRVGHEVARVVQDRRRRDAFPPPDRIHCRGRRARASRNRA